MAAGFFNGRAGVGLWWQFFSDNTSRFEKYAAFRSGSYDRGIGGISKCESRRSLLIRAAYSYQFSNI